MRRGVPGPDYSYKAPEGGDRNIQGSGTPEGFREAAGAAARSCFGPAFSGERLGDVPRAPGRGTAHDPARIESRTAEHGGTVHRSRNERQGNTPSPRAAPLAGRNDAAHATVHRAAMGTGPGSTPHRAAGPGCANFVGETGGRRCGRSIPYLSFHIRQPLQNQAHRKPPPVVNQWHTSCFSRRQEAGTLRRPRA